MFMFSLILFLIKLIFYLTVLFVVFVIGVKLWLEPIKGFCKCTTKLHGKIVLVTGGNTGIGLETARELARRGARVIIASRNVKKSEAAVTDIIQSTGNHDVESRYLDLSKFSCIRKFCDDFNNTVSRLDVLVNNAGCGGVGDHLTEDGVDLVTQINYLGPFLLTNMLLKKLIESKPSRIVIVSSHASYFAKFDPEDVSNLKVEGKFTKYCNTKLCNVLWAKALSKRLPKGVTANSLHPGVVKTDIFNNLHPVLRMVLLATTQIFFKNPKEGAQTSVHLCVGPDFDNISGEYYSDCKPSAVAKEAKNEELIEKVWAESVRLTSCQ